MKKIVATLLFLFIWFSNAQEPQETVDFDFETDLDSITYIKTTDIDTERNFTTSLKEKYSGKDFQYKEYETKSKTKSKTKSSNSGSAFLGFLFFFMSSIFPFLLGGFVIFIIVKVALGADFRFWNTTNTSKNLTKKLIYEEEDINEIDINTLLQQAIAHKDFRLAIRYYYLATLKSLSKKQLIDYHKDKTNSEYLFEIENTSLRTQFSYLSYVYTYVWYGEFPVNETNFKLAENKYQSFLKSLI